jgi:hypothetical protein
MLSIKDIMVLARQSCEVITRHRYPILLFLDTRFLRVIFLRSS